ncbi:hypothetical protein [Jiella avicenniae]|uniref:Uncharacterized protein n=1 Tax=Jiella avicenniae TaxID=2907202 RepID=A0A9X1NZ71_9HYPH|nr:hypothetical protein [Jiella avicenniae]MCE7026421.1 hypothetical protein [Jiella avicenniae]
MTEDGQDRHGVEPEEEAGGPEPSTADFLEMASRMLGGGFAGMEASPADLRGQIDAHRTAMKKEADIFRDTFSTPQGRKCLDILIDRTLRRRIYGAAFETSHLETLTVATIVRETENNFVAGILEAIAFADNKDTIVRQDA